jgi:transposase
MKALVVTCPASLREQLRGLSTKKLVATCARLRPGPLEGPEAAAKTALRSMAVRVEGLDSEDRDLRLLLDELTTQAAPRLRQRVGVGPDCASALLLAAGDNPERLHSESAFSMLCGASPVQASSGKITRHRLNRGGDRQANAALYRIVLVRLRYDVRTQEYVERRTKEGMSKSEIIRCLKRYVAREVYQAITDVAPIASN